MDRETSDLPGAAVTENDFCLAEWLIQPRERLLTGPNGSERLDPKAMQVLIVLCEQAPRAVSRDELIQAVWGKTAVSDDALTFCIGQLRKALRDDRRTPRFIETVHKTGYRLLVLPTPHAGTASSNANTVPSENLSSPKRPLLLLLLWVMVAVLLSIGLYWALTPSAAITPHPVAADIAADIKPIPPGKRLLWVDDRPEYNIDERRQLENAGLTIELALSTTEALQRLANNHYDLVISDMGRKEGPDEGYVLLAAIRERDARLPVIFFASSNAAAFVDEAKRRGASGITNQRDELIRLVADTLAPRQRISH